MSEINVITATFGSQRKAMTMPILYQYDVVQMLKIRGLDLPTYYEVEFCNANDTTSVNITGSAEDGVQIPDSLIMTGRKIKAYIVLTSADSVQTRYEITIPVYRREPRNDIDPTDDQQLQIDALVAALNDAINRAEAVEDLLEGGDEDQILRKNSDDDLDFSWTDEKIFIANYGTTEYADVADAVTAGKAVFCYYNYAIYTLGKQIDGDTNFYFTTPKIVSSTGMAIYCVYVDYLNGWHNTDVTIKPSIVTPLMDGEADVGNTYSQFARADHVHPHDTSKANAEDVPTKTSDLTNDSGFITASDVPTEVFWATYGTTTYSEIGTALTAEKLVMCEYSGIYYRYLMRDFNARWFTAPGENVLYWLKVTSGNVWSQGAIYPAATASPLMDGTAAVGSSSKYAREDHVHPSDTSKITMPSGGSVGQVLKKTANGTEWADESGSGGAEEVFWATYGVTTNAEIDAAYSAGKVVLVEHNDMIAVLTVISVGDDFAEFCAAYGEFLYTYSCESDTWSSHNRVLGTYSKPSGGIPASDLASGVIPTVPAAATDAPAMDGTAAVGTSTKYAKADHVHPSDTSRMTAAQVNAAINHSLQALSPEDIGAASAVEVVVITDDGAVTQALNPDVIYEFAGTLTALTITLNAATAPAQYHFRFDSGSTAVSLTLPQTVTMPSGFQVEANKHYEIDILDGYGVAQSW